MNKILFILMTVFALSSIAKTDVLGKITYRYMIDDKTGVTYWEPTEHHMIFNKESTMKIDDHKNHVVNALKARAQKEALLGAKKTVTKNENVTVKVLSTSKFSKMISTDYANAAAVHEGTSKTKTKEAKKTKNPLAGHDPDTFKRHVNKGKETTKGKKGGKETLPEEREVSEDFDFSGPF